jgi:hypothetical protein
MGVCVDHCHVPILLPWALPLRSSLRDFRLHQGERFRSVCDYIANWQYNIHLEAILPLIQYVSIRPAGSSKPTPMGGISFGGTTPALGRLHVVFSRQGMAKMILGLVTDDPEPSRRELPHFFSVSLHPGMQTDAHHEKEAA